MKILPCCIYLAASLLLTGCSRYDGVKITGMYCNNMISPVGVEGNPVFRWIMEGRKDSSKLSRWELRLEADGKMARFEGTDGNEWIYDGLPLASGKKYTWKVQLTDERGSMTAWSPTASFVTGIPDSAWTHSNWIAFESLPDSMKIIPAVHLSGDTLGPKGLRRPVVPLFRREFSVSKEIEGAYLFVSGLGHYALTIDGRSPDDRFLAPGWTLYSKTCYYNGYDITSQLTPGKHAIGVTAGNGFFNVNRERYRKLVSAWGMPMIRLRLLIRYADGSSEQLDSDENWKTFASPITFTSIYGGEDFDARLLQPGWNMPGFDDTKWKSVLKVKGPGGLMKHEEDYPMKVMETFKPAGVKEMPDGTYVYDFGQNASGIPGIIVSNAAGQQVRLTPGEVLDDHGLINQEGSGGPMYFEYTGAGKGDEKWEPLFSYYGFRYVGVSGAVPAGFPNPGNKPQIKEILFHHTRNSSPSAGSFQCSNELFNRIFNLINWGVRSNLASVVTDCPHREKLGWLEQVHLMGASIQYSYDVRNLYTKIVEDMMDSQLENGLVPDIAPEYVPFVEGFRDSPEWGSSAVILPYYIYQWYGDRRLMERAWPMMTRYEEYLQTKADHWILSHGLGDWCDLGPEYKGFAQLTPEALTATSIYFYDLSILAEMAAILQKSDESAYYRKRAAEVKASFLRRFYNPATHVIATGSQTSYAMPLVVGLIDAGMREEVYDAFIQAIKRDGYALTAGDVGFHYVVRALQDAGAHDVIWKMNSRDDVPGYGYQLRKGATALTESWPAHRFVSNNHLMLGHLMEWFYSGIGGIRQAEGSVGYKRIIIDPQPVGDLTWAEVSHTCMKGDIYVKWEKKNGGTAMKIKIPFDCEADVRFGGKEIGRYTAGNYDLFIEK